MSKSCRVALTFVSLLALATPILGTEHAEAATVTTVLTPDYHGRTSRGGVNQAFTYRYTGSSSGYGDVWNSSYIFDLASLRSDEVNITSATIELDVYSFENDRSEEMTFTLGSFTGSLEQLSTLVFRSPDFRTDRTLYAAMMATTYGATRMPSALSQGDVLAVEFNRDGLAALNAVANGTDGTDIGMAGSFGYPVWQGGADQLLITTGAKLTLGYEVVDRTEQETLTPVPLPASSLLLLCALASTGLMLRQRS